MFRKSSNHRINSISSTTSEEQKDSKDRKITFNPEDDDFSIVHLYDCHKLLPLSKDLAQNYHHSGDSITNICMKNASLAFTANQEFIAETWSILSVLAMNENLDHNEEHLMPWSELPFGRDLVASRIKHHLKCHDIQTIAVVSAVLSSEGPKFCNEELNVEERFASSSRKTSSISAKNLEFIDTGRDVAMEAEQNSELCFNDDEKIFVPSNKADGLIDNDEKIKYEVVQKQYVSLLQRCGFWMQGAEIKKLLKFEKESDHRMAIRLATTCSRCSVQKKESSSKSNKFLSFCRVCQIKNIYRICVICNIRCTQGVISVCVDCGHGGHIEHMEHWFARKKSCPDVNCSCPCPSYLPL